MGFRYRNRCTLGHQDPLRWNRSRRAAYGYAIAALLLLFAAGTELKLGIDAEGKSLERIADPLSG